ncbi:hypothetical protein [Fimbriimonas ginsengisoli]|uniref:Uncharacterized protein n=1 Tax=Fimbriimonas ginsengisoli Gsoil 348 TaxID=661478 RepID=A0A068NWW3_FIMGI|nr:hypothetical protein [Fimbriimonas ginsengisoli]AIE88003.1 hypothetical protein OP10G_4635 [Fimbriimonas ginsengisoli Gsoil 348]
MPLSEAFVNEFGELAGKVIDLERSILEKYRDSDGPNFITLDSACVSITRFATCWLENEDLRDMNDWETLFNVHTREQLEILATNLQAKKIEDRLTHEDVVRMEEVGTLLWDRAMCLTNLPSIMAKIPRYLMNGTRIA